MLDEHGALTIIRRLKPTECTQRKVKFVSGNAVTVVLNPFTGDLSFTINDYFHYILRMGIRSITK